jgi:hypothetical protein
MSRIPPTRGQASKRMDLSNLKHVLRDERVWCFRGEVFAPGGQSHWFVDTDGSERRVYVNVQALPSGLDVTCKLGTCSSGAGTGLWFIPKVGTKVVVDISDGAIDGFPVIVGVEDSGGFPDRAGDTRVVLVATVPIEITGPTVTLGPRPEEVGPTDALVHGSGIDPFTGAPYFALGNCTQFVFAKKE